MAESAETLTGAGYSSAFAVRADEADARSPEQWARAAFEGAPRAIGWFVVFGWRFVLGLRLGPSRSARHVLGWSISPGAPGVLTLEARSPLLTARKLVRVEGTEVVMTTFVRFDRRLAAALWALVAPVHHRTEPYLLGRAASRPPLGGRADA